MTTQSPTTNAAAVRSSDLLAPFYEDEYVTLYNADCRDVIPQLPIVDLLVTDPPYFLPSQTYPTSNLDGETAYRKTLADASMLKGYFDLFFAEINPKLSEKAIAYVFCDDGSYPFLYQAMFRHFHELRLLVWDKVNTIRGYTWRKRHELIAYGRKKAGEEIPSGIGSIIQENGIFFNDRVHPVQKPVALMRRLIERHTGGIVLDPFAGSGSTLIAAKQCRKKAIGIEAEIDHCNTIVDALCKTTPDGLLGELLGANAGTERTAADK